MTDPVEPVAPAGARPRAGRVGRALTGVLVLALTGGVVAAAALAPETAADPLPAATVAVAPVATTLVCPGPLQLPDDALSGDAAFDRVPVAPVERVAAFDTVASGSASLTVLGGAPTAFEGGTGLVRTPAAATILRADPVDGTPARVAGATSSVVTDGDLRGLSAGSCARPW